MKPLLHDKIGPSLSAPNVFNFFNVITLSTLFSGYKCNLDPLYGKLAPLIKSISH